ncbi:MAG: hypothetical protein ACJAYU_000464 [Bradymonadia bacterium]|jgi:hypothetical protein
MSRSAAVECFNEDGPVGEELTLAASQLVTCELVGAQDDPIVEWSWEVVQLGRFEMQVTRASNAVDIEPGFLGTGDLVARFGSCTTVGPTLIVGPPEAGLFAYLMWSSTADSDARTDLDLHLLRDPVCWFDPDEDLHHGSESWLDWGTPNDPAGDVRRGVDARSVPGMEFVAADSIAGEETWVFGVESRVEAGTVVSAAVSFYLDGTSLAQVERELTGPGVWTVGTFSDELTISDEIAAEPPACGPRPCEATGPEVCNGLDDDCNGAVDEHPTTCENEGAAPGSVCAYLPGLEEYACVEP